MESEGTARPGSREAVMLTALLAATFVLRALFAGQPIVENYVGRQVPTAMVARNLERGSGFLHPQLHTAPLPNLFLVEPPVYAALVVELRRGAGLALDPAGRLVSALGLTLGAWGLFGLVRRREGGRTALIALAAFAIFPITIRYGRAFQPDALMLGCLLAGLRCWDEREAGGGRGWLVAGWTLLAAGLALKVVSAYVLVPLVFVILRPPRWRKAALALSTLLPALLWYAHAAYVLREGGGSKASADNGTIWLRVLVPSALFRAATMGHVVRFLMIRAFTPLGFVLGLGGVALERFTIALPTLGRARLRPSQPCSEDESSSPTNIARDSPSRVAARDDPSARRLADGSRLARAEPRPPKNACAGQLLTAPGRADRLWRVWGLSACAALAVLAAKLHHEYYWLALAPLAAVGVGRALEALSKRTQLTAVVAACGLVALSIAQSASTWRTPAEWSRLDVAARIVQDNVPEDAWIAAPEALLYAADRRGCRLEFTHASARRAAGEWGPGELPEDSRGLVEFYRSRGAQFVADLGDGAAAGDSERLALHKAIRSRYKVLVDLPGVLLLAALTDPAPRLSQGRRAWLPKTHP